MSEPNEDITTQPRDEPRTADITNKSPCGNSERGELHFDRRSLKRNNLVRYILLGGLFLLLLLVVGLVTVGIDTIREVATRSPYDGTVVSKERIALGGQRDRIRSLCFSPDGSRLASGSEDGSIQIWDTTAWKSETTIQEVGERPSPVLSVAYSPNGNRLAAGKGNGTTKLYDEACKELMTFRVRDQWVRCVAFSPDGRQVASAENDGSVIIWDTESGKSTKSFKGSGDAVWCVAFSPDGTVVASGGWETNVVRIWDVASGQEIQRLSGVRGIARSLVFFADGQTVATGGDFVWLHDPVTGAQKALLRGHVTNSTSLAVSPDGTVLVSGGQAGEVKVWDIATGKVRATYWGDPREEVWSVALSPDGKTIASGTAKGTIKIWDMVK